MGSSSSVSESTSERQLVLRLRKLGGAPPITQCATTGHRLPRAAGMLICTIGESLICDLARKARDHTYDRLPADERQKPFLSMPRLIA